MLSSIGRSRIFLYDMSVHCGIGMYRAVSVKATTRDLSRVVSGDMSQSSPVGCGNKWRRDQQFLDARRNTTICFSSTRQSDLGHCLK